MPAFAPELGEEEGEGAGVEEAEADVKWVVAVNGEGVLLEERDD